MPNQLTAWSASISYSKNALSPVNFLPCRVLRDKIARIELHARLYNICQQMGEVNNQMNVRLVKKFNFRPDLSLASWTAGSGGAPRGLMRSPTTSKFGS